MSFSEEKTVQDPIIKYATQLGWKYLDEKQLEEQRKTKERIILEDIFINSLLKLNPFLDYNLAIEVKKDLENVLPNIEGNYHVLKYLRGEITVYLPEEKRARNVKVIDFENPKNNEFHIVKEFEFTNGVRTIRQDVVLFINGIPLVFFECKAPYKEEAIREAFNQVRRYHDECPELLAIEQIFVITNNLDIFYGATWEFSAKNLNHWRLDEKESSSFEERISAFLRNDFVIKLLVDYTFFVIKDDIKNKVVLRQHQIRAVEKIIERARSKDKKRGLIWHTQGSGKTYTMIIAAKKLIELKEFENPTIIMIVDRTELQNQLIQNLKNLGFENIEEAKSIENLRDLLKEDRRGLIVSMIHKFRGMPENINLRNNIFVLVDEAHRSTSGDLGTYLLSALPNAKFFGFTGTPIDSSKTGKGTFATFGIDDPPKGYLDKYGILESIRDGTTVKLNYTLARTELLVDKEVLDEEFFNFLEENAITDIEENDRILEKCVRMKSILKSKDRISKMAKFIAEHFKNNVEPLGYKAFIVAVDREACAMYKEEIDKYLPEEYTRVIFSPDPNDKELKKYHLSDEEIVRLRRDFLDPEKMPKIFIVTNMLLTGFDAPILYCMYLDKPMSDHALLQAIARVNRPYEDKTGRKKPCGLIIDSVGIFANLKKALSFDSSDIEGILNDIKELKIRFEKLMNLEIEKYEDLRKIIQILDLEESEDEKLEMFLTEFENKDLRELFYEYFAEVSSIYDILSPDECLRPYIKRMADLVKLYNTLNERFTVANKSYKINISEKVEELVKKNVKTYTVESSNNEVEIDQEFIEKLKKGSENKRVTIFKVLKEIRKCIRSHSKEHYGFLYSLGEKVERLILQYDENHLNSEEVLKELINYAEKIRESMNEKKKTKLNDLEYTIYFILKNEYNINSEQLAKNLAEVFSKYRYWYKSKEQAKKHSQELYKILKEKSQLSWDERKDIVKKLKEKLSPLN